MRVRIAVIASMVASSGLTQAQVASSHLNSEAPLPGAPGQTVEGIGAPGLNQVGGFAVTVETNGSAGPLSYVWGSSHGAPGGVLITEGTHSGVNQYDFDTHVGISNAGDVTYSGSGFMPPSFGSNGVWTNTALLAFEETPSTIPGSLWRKMRRPGMTANGTPYFYANLEYVSGTYTTADGIFIGNQATPLLAGGQSLPSLPFPLESWLSSEAFDFRISALGTHYIVEANMATASNQDDGVLIMDGVGLLAGGSLLREGTLVEPAIGGDGSEYWENFDFLGVNEHGDWLATGNSDGPLGNQDLVLLNGLIIHRVGDVVDGRTLTGTIERAALGEAGDYAVMWKVTSPSGNLECLLRNGHLDLIEGDELDVDNDGVRDPGVVLTDFTGLGSLALEPTGAAWFNASYDDQGIATHSGLFRMPCVQACAVLTYCTAKVNSLGCTPSIAATGTPSLSSPLPFSISTDQVLNNKPGVLFYGFAPNGLPFQGGFLCVQPPVRRTPAQLSGGNPPPNDCSGVYQFDFNPWIQGGSDPNLTLGTQVYGQYWSRDSQSPSTTGLTDAVGFTIQP